MLENTNDRKNSTSNQEMWKIINLMSLFLIFIVSYFLIFMQTIGRIHSDTYYHVFYIDQYINGEIFVPHPLWHISTYYLSKLLEVDYNTGTSIFTAFMITLYAIVIYKITQNLDEFRENQTKWFLVTFITFAIGPFFVMSLNPHIYMGPGSPSVWHSVTLLTVKPLALLSVFYTIKFFISKKLYFSIWAAIVTILSIFAKPSFIIVFLPSLVVYLLLKRYFDKQRLLFVLIIVLLSIASLGYQFMNQYESNGVSTGGSIIFDFLGVWSMITPSVPVSIVMALGLPFLITLLNYQSIKENEYIKFTWLLVFFSLILFACFAEGGKRYTDGNFSWSWHLSLSLIYVFTIIEYFKQY